MSHFFHISCSSVRGIMTVLCFRKGHHGSVLPCMASNKKIISPSDSATRRFQLEIRNYFQPSSAIASKCRTGSAASIESGPPRTLELNMELNDRGQLWNKTAFLTSLEVSSASYTGLASGRRGSHCRKLHSLESIEGALLRGFPLSNEGVASSWEEPGSTSESENDKDEVGRALDGTVPHTLQDPLDRIVCEVEGRIGEVHKWRLGHSSDLREAAGALLEMGASAKQVIRILSFRRQRKGVSFVLKNNNLDTLIREKGKLLAVFGVSAQQFIRMAAVYPPLLRSSDHNILEAVQMLQQIGVQNLAPVLCLLSNHSGMRPPPTFMDNVRLVCSAGVKDVVAMVERDPSFLYIPPLPLEEKVSSLVSLLGTDETGALLERAPHLLTMRIHTVAETYQGLTSLVGREKVMQMLAKQPRILSLSWNTVQPKIQLITGSMGYSLMDLVGFPTALTASMERMAARGRALPLLEVERRPALSSLMCSEKNFIKNFGFRLSTGNESEEEEETEYDTNEGGHSVEGLLDNRTTIVK